MIALHLANLSQFAWAQQQVSEHHYLHAPVDSRCSPVAYVLTLDRYLMGCLIFGRPESTRCYDGALTYGSLKDVEQGKAQFDRWEVLNLARVWLHPQLQASGVYYSAKYLPGYETRKGEWRSRLASWCILEALQRVGYDYLMQRPPCFPEEPYNIRAVLSYCDLNQHKGRIYEASGFRLARVNERGIATYYTTAVAPLSSYQNDMVLKRAGQSFRSRLHRSQRAVQGQQEALL